MMSCHHLLLGSPLALTGLSAYAVLLRRTAAGSGAVFCHMLQVLLADMADLHL